MRDVEQNARLAGWTARCPRSICVKGGPQRKSWQNSIAWTHHRSHGILVEGIVPNRQHRFENVPFLALSTLSIDLQARDPVVYARLEIGVVG